MENEDLARGMRKFEQERREGAVQDKEGNVAGSDKNENDLMMPAFSEDYANNETAIEDDATNEGVEEEGAHDMKCTYPNCLFGSGGPPLHFCQGTCEKKHGLHHACNVNWFESKGINAELSKLCYVCLCLSMWLLE